MEVNRCPEMVMSISYGRTKQSEAPGASFGRSAHGYFTIPLLVPAFLKASSISLMVITAGS